MDWVTGRCARDHMADSRSVARPLTQLGTWCSNFGWLEVEKAQKLPRAGAEHPSPRSTRGEGQQGGKLYELGTTLERGLLPLSPSRERDAGHLPAADSKS